MTFSKLTEQFNQPINYFRDYPLIGEQIMRRAIAEVIASRALYPFTPTQIIPTKDGYYAW